MKEFPSKDWTRSGLDHLLRRIDARGSADRAVGSGRPRSARTSANITKVEELVCSQEGAPGTHKSPREIEQMTGIPRSSVRRIMKKDLTLKSYKRIVGQKMNADCRVRRLERCQELLRRFPSERSVQKIWFTDEKTFTVATPVNSQNDRVYSAADKKSNVDPRRLIRERQHFSRSVMVSVGVSKMGKTRLAFVEPGAKINSDYYCNDLLGRNLLPDIRQTCGRHNWILQQDGAPSHTAASTVAFLQREKIHFIEPHAWPPNSPDINPVDYAVWGALQQRVYLRRKFESVDELKRVLTLEWGRLSQNFINQSIAEWRQRLQTVVQNSGAHIEHLFK